MQLVKPCLAGELSFILWQQQVHHSVSIATTFFALKFSLEQWGRQEPHCQWVQWSRAERWVWQKKDWRCQATALHSSSGIFRIIFLGFTFGFLKKRLFACPELLLLSLWRLCCSSCSTMCQAVHEISQLPQGWQSLGRPDSTVQISRDFELFSASFKDHPVISLYILQTLIKIFLLQFF